jgi:hypothetical protein
MNLPGEVPHEADDEDGEARRRRPASSHLGDTAVGGDSSELMLLMYVLGGREVGQVTVFRRPLSVWRLDLTRL